jgi:hypothetical protein
LQRHREHNVTARISCQGILSGAVCGDELAKLTR